MLNDKIDLTARPNSIIIERSISILKTMSDFINTQLKKKNRGPKGDSPKSKLTSEERKLEEEKKEGGFIEDV
jgi:hypothetical protein